MNTKPLPQALDPAALCADCDESGFHFRSSEELEPLEGWIGQDRAIGALQMAARTRHRDFNLFVLGTPGSGRRRATRELLKKQAGARQTPDDWVYVNDFKDAQKPRALRLPTGRGAELRRGMEELVDDLANDIPAQFESEEYQTRRRAIEEAYSERHEEAMQALVERAREQNTAILRTPMGLAVAATREGEVLKPEEFEKLPQEEKDRIEDTIGEIQSELEAIMAEVPRQQKQHRIDVENLNVELVTASVEHSVSSLLDQFGDLPDILAHVEAVRTDIVQNAELFLMDGNQPKAGAFPVATTRHYAKPHFQRYAVNVIVSNSIDSAGAPIVEESLPSLGNLIGRIEHVSEMGTLVTNFTMIKGGALHRANGGYLILDARKLLSEPFAWDALKRCLGDEEISVVSAAERFSFVSTVSLKPDPVPLDVRVILIGDRQLYYLLAALDPEFSTLFKLQADFSDEVARDPETTQLYARLLATLVRRSDLRALSPSGMARMITESTRLADDAERLSLNVADLSDILREADFWADESGADLIGKDEIEQALDAREKRSDRIPALTQEAITRETILIDTDGEKTGQINALSVLQIGGHRFGRPSRVSARVRMGDGTLVDIERETNLGGSLHSKGIMILQGYLRATFAPDVPLSLWASIVFEQSYGGVDGDSASAAELIALLSALSELPLKQSFAITGSVNQFGEIQAIGGVNEKIEGFFDICAARGLTGRQGVLIPAANVKHLSLRRRVSDAVRDGRFAIYPIAHVNDGLHLLTGVEPGRERLRSGHFEDGSVNALAEARLLAFAKARRAFGQKKSRKA